MTTQRPVFFFEFTDLLHGGNEIDKNSLYDGCMHIEETEIDSWMPDWSPKRISPVDTRERKGLEPFLRSQRAVLLRLREELFASMAGVAVSSRATSETSLFKTHQADAGSDTYDRDFALSLLSHEHNSLYEIEQALQRIELGTYGICEISGKPIPQERLKAIPFARFTVDVQSRLEREKRAWRFSEITRSLFSLADGERSEGGDEEGLPDGGPEPTGESEKPKVR